MVSTQIAPHVISQLALPTYDATAGLHLEIAALSQAAHAGMPVYAELDARAAQLFGLSPSQLAAATDFVQSRGHK